jgi:calpain-7
MKAMRLSSNADEKKQLKAQCGDIMNVADRIKNTEAWKPSVAPQPSNSRNEQIGQWAAEVAVNADSGAAFEDITSESGSSHYGLSSTLVPVEDTRATSGKSSRGVTYDTPMLLMNLSNDAFPSPVNNTPRAPTDAPHEDSSDAVLRNQVPTGAVHNTQINSSVQPSLPPQVIPKTEPPSLSPSTAPYSQIHRLREPVSSRKLPAKESIILLKASMVNGFKCPPWDKTPSIGEFMLQEGEVLFT